MPDPLHDPTAGETTSLGGAEPVDPPAIDRGLTRGREIGRYVVLAELGSGGMGVVYKAWDPALDRPVALKILGAGRFAAPVQIARFFDEARAIARFDDPALVTIFDVGVLADCPYFTMEFVDGRTLADVVAADGPLPPRRIAALGAAVARGLHHAHAQGVIHRDVKPANVMLDRAGAPRVIDFGIARLLESSDDRTRTGQVLGTPAWMAPEQAHGRGEAIGPATDVYGLGGVVYHGATGQRPRPVAGEGDLLDGPPLPRDLRAICRRALAERPADRYPDAAALADDLDRFTRGEPVAAALPGPARRAAWWLHRRRHGLAALLAMALLLALGVVGWQAWREHRVTRAARAEQARREAAAAGILAAAHAEGRALRAAGAPERAAAIEREAGIRADVQATRALARYHLDRAAAAVARDAPDEALSAATTAYAVAPHDAERLAALLAMGNRFIDAWDAPALAALGATLRRRFPRDRAAAARLALHELILTRRLREAADHPAAPADWRPLLRALGHATRTAHHKRGGKPWHEGHDLLHVADITGDGRLDGWLDGRLLDLSTPALAPRPELTPPPLPPGAALVPVPGHPGLFHTRGAAPADTLWRHDPTGWRPLGDLPLPEAGPVTVADLDGDGHPELYAGAFMRLRGAPIPAPGQPLDWQIADPAAEAAEIGVRVVRAARLGRDALIVGAAGWIAYDLRVYRGDGTGRLTRAARRQVGAVEDAIALPDPQGRHLIAAALRTPRVDAVLFHPDAPPLDDGVHLFEWTATGLDHRAQLTRAPRGHGPQRLFTGDLDGDGLDDLIAASARDTDPPRVLIVRRRPDGWAPPLPLPGLWPFAAADLDGDGDAELIAGDPATGAIWTLGAGDDPPPSIDHPAPPPADAAAPDAALEDLVAFGQLDAALDGWTRALTLGRAPPGAAARAAAIAERLARWSEAAALHHRAAAEATGANATAAHATAANATAANATAANATAANATATHPATTDPPAADEAAAARHLLAAAAAWQAARRPRQAADTLRALLARPRLAPADRATARDHLAAADATLRHRLPLDLSAPLAPGWQLPLTDRVSRDPDATLDLRGDLVGPIARLPLRRTADRVAIEVELDVTRVEWPATLTLALTSGPPDAPVDLVAVTLSAWGGAALFEEMIAVELQDAPRFVLARHPLTGTAGHGVRAHVELDLTRAALLIIDRHTERRFEHTLAPDAPQRAPGDALTFEIRGRPTDLGVAPTIDARLRALTLYGVALAPAPAETPTDTAARALADGRPHDARAALDHAPADERADALRAATRYALGERDAADDLLRARLRAGVPPNGPFDRFVRNRLRQSPLPTAALLRHTLGAAADDLLWRTFGAGLAAHPDDPALVQAASAALLAAEAADPAALPAPHHRASLHLARARIYRRAGVRGDARADLRACEALLIGAPPPTSARLATYRARLLTAVHLDHARLDARADPDHAAHALRAALAASPHPAITADQIRADDTLRWLRDHPIWATVEATAAR